jgi:hypothetical protein
MYGLDISPLRATNLYVGGFRVSNQIGIRLSGDLRET